MHRPDLPSRIVLVIGLGVAVAILGYPAAFMLTHGLNPEGWPPIDGTPPDWFAAMGAHRFSTLVLTYIDMMLGKSPAFVKGGSKEFWSMTGGLAVVGAGILWGGKLVPLRHWSRRYGDARWASPKDRSFLKYGLWIGTDLDTKMPLRVPVEGNLLTIAPPRSGKTGGFILPNLVCLDEYAWDGPVVVIDPKGDCYKAAKRRREALGRRARCIDPLGLVGGRDRWNPLLKADPDKVIYLQSIARALLPAAKSQSETAAYFRGRAVTLVTAALRTVIRSGGRNLVEAARLLSDSEVFKTALRQDRHQVAHQARAILDSDERTREPIRQSAAQVFEWCLDERVQAVVSGQTFEMSDVRDGVADLFIVLPADGQGEILAPFVRWLLADLFAAVRKERARDRIVVFIDEAAVLGPFDAILKGVGELPGYGVSLWTVWQTRSQIAETYGEHGVSTILGTAEVVSLFNTSKVLPAETEYWSKAIGTFTAVRQGSDPKGRTGDGDAVEQYLVPASELATFTQTQSITFITSRFFTTDPILCGKTFAHDHPRIAALLDQVAPTGPLRTAGRRG